MRIDSSSRNRLTKCQVANRSNHIFKKVLNRNEFPIEIDLASRQKKLKNRHFRSIEIDLNGKRLFEFHRCLSINGNDETEKKYTKKHWHPENV